MDELTIAERALLPSTVILEEEPKRVQKKCAVKVCTEMATRSDGMCCAHSALQMTRDAIHEAARDDIKRRLRDYAKLHYKAAEIAASKGDARPAQWALESEKVVEPPVKESTVGVPKVTVNIGMALPGLGLK